MMMGESDSGRSSLGQSVERLPPSLRGIFQKIVDGVGSALQVTLMDTLVGEFHEKFNIMWNAPGDRDAARTLRQCDRTHRETATKVVKEVLASQLALLAKTEAEAMRKGGAGDDNLPDGVLSIIESKVARLEEQVTAFECMME